MMLDSTEYIKFYEKLTILIGHRRRRERKRTMVSRLRSWWKRMACVEIETRKGEQVWVRNNEFHFGHMELDWGMGECQAERSGEETLGESRVYE